MAIIVGNETRLVVQGATGREGSFHTLRNRDYGTDVVAGVTPGKGGQDLDGIPIFDTVAEAVDETGANTSMVFVPARFAADAIYEGVDAGIETVICIAEGLPAHEMLRIFNYVKPRGITMLGPNCPGALSPGKANVGIIPAEIFREGRIGLVSRSGTLTYQIGHELTQLGLGNSTIVGIGGDPVVGSSFIDVLARFEADDETEVVVMVGEIGGAEEEKAAEFIGAEMTKPVVGYIAGFSAPPGKTMGRRARGRGRRRRSRLADLSRAVVGAGVAGRGPAGGRLRRRRWRWRQCPLVDLSATPSTSFVSGSLGWCARWQLSTASSSARTQIRRSGRFWGSTLPGRSPARPCGASSESGRSRSSVRINPYSDSPTSLAR